jgi:hypothetical protein
MKTISATLLGLFFMLMLSSTAFADSALGQVTVPEGGHHGGSSHRNITVYNLNITNGSVSVSPEQISLPLADETTGRKILFDIGVKINKKNVFVNEKLVSTISLINLGVPGEVKAVVYYRIIDEKGDVVYEESEMVLVETQKEFIKEFDVSKLDEGEYTLFSEIKYEEQKEPARAEDVFYVQKTLMQKFGVMIILALVVLIILTVFCILFKERVYLRSLAKKVHLHFAP